MGVVHGYKRSAVAPSKGNARPCKEFDSNVSFEGDNRRRKRGSHTVLHPTRCRRCDIGQNSGVGTAGATICPWHSPCLLSLPSMRMCLKCPNPARGVVGQHRWAAAAPATGNKLLFIHLRVLPKHSPCDSFPYFSGSNEVSSQSTA